MTDLLEQPTEAPNVGRLLPPGLYFPTADEDVGKYKSDNFSGGELEDWRVLDYGSFVVALAAFGVADGNRVSLMPTKTDLQELRTLGYGPSVTRITREYGGIKKLQADLGFYPYQFQPGKEELLARYSWLASDVIDLEKDINGTPTVKKIIEWCSIRDLAPQSAIVYDTLDRNVDEVRTIFGIQEKDLCSKISYGHMYKLGTQALQDNGGIPKIEELKKNYGHEVPIRLQTVMEHHFGGYNKFWLEFGKIFDTSGLSPEEIINFSTRMAIRTGERAFERSTVVAYAANQELPTIASIDHRVGGLIAFREGVAKNLERYDAIVDELAESGISSSVVRAFCAKFEPTDDFMNWLDSGKPVLAKLSARNGAAVEYLLKLISSGFDLINDDIFDHQLHDFAKLIKRFGFKSSGLRFMLQATPRVNAEELMQRLKECKLI